MRAVSEERPAPLWLLVLLAAPGQVATGAFLPGLPLMAVAFAAPVQTAQLAVTAYIAAFAVGQLPAGWLADRAGRRVVAFAGGIVFTAAALFAVTAPSLAWLIGLRAVEGVGAGALLVAGRAVMRDQDSGPALARALAKISAAVWILGGLAGVIGGAVTQALGWRASLLPVAALGVAILAASHRLPRSWPAAPDHGWGAVLRSRSFWRHASVAAAMVGAFYAFLTGGPAILVDELGLPPALLGIVQLGAVAAFWASATVARARNLGPVGLAIGIVACAAMLGLAPAGLLQTGPVLLCLAGLASSAGLVMPVALAEAIAPFPDRAGAANAAANLLQTFAAAGASTLVSLPGPPQQVVPACMLGWVVLAFMLDRGLACRGLPSPV